MKPPDSFEKVRASGAGKAQVFPLNWRRKSVSILVALAFLIGILGCIQVQAQLRDRTLSGKVISPSDTPVANARLVLKNSTSSDIRSATVKSDGTYLLANLLPGTYEIIASAQGFADAHATVVISADGNPVVNLVMQPASTTGASGGEVGSSTVKGDVTTSVSELPLNGRSASDVAALEPGVATARTQASGQAQRGFGTEMTISGGRPRQNDSSASTTTPMAHPAAPSASTWEWMRWSNSRC